MPSSSSRHRVVIRRRLHCCAAAVRRLQSIGRRRFVDGRRRRAGAAHRRHHRTTDRHGRRNVRPPPLPRTTYSVRAVRVAGRAARLLLGVRGVRAAAQPYSYLWKRLSVSRSHALHQSTEKKKSRFWCGRKLTYARTVRVDPPREGREPFLGTNEIFTPLRHVKARATRERTHRTTTPSIFFSTRRKVNPPPPTHT